MIASRRAVNCYQFLPHSEGPWFSLCVSAGVRSRSLDTYSVVVLGRVSHPLLAAARSSARSISLTGAGCALTARQVLTSAPRVLVNLPSVVFAVLGFVVRIYTCSYLPSRPLSVRSRPESLEGIRLLRARCRFLVREWVLILRLLLRRYNATSRATISALHVYPQAAVVVRQYGSPHTSADCSFVFVGACSLVIRWRALRRLRINLEGLVSIAGGYYVFHRGASYSWPSITRSNMPIEMCDNKVIPATPQFIDVPMWSANSMR